MERIVKNYKSFLIKESIDTTGFKIIPEGAAMPTSGVVKLGIDPTSDKLHLGHLVPLRMFKKLKDNGMDGHIVLGTFTAKLGDPSGRNESRPMLSEATTKANADSLISQIKRVVGNDIKIHFNTEWFNKMTLLEIMDILSKYTVDHLMSRDSFQKRQESGGTIGAHELIVPILQGIDSVELKAKIEVGGTDQLFNFLMSRDIQSKMGQEPEICVMAPIINGTDGRKMSKSFNNCIYINDSPTDVFGKAMSISDETMYQWIPIFLEHADVSIHPMQLKKSLAVEITNEIWGKGAGESERAKFESNVQSKNIPDDIKEFENNNDIFEVIKEIAKVSKSDGRRLLQQGAVTINGEKMKIDDKFKSGDIVKVGKRNFGKIK